MNLYLDDNSAKGLLAVLLHDLVQSTHGQHMGIVAVRSDNDPNRDMKDRDIIRALRNLEGAGVPIANEFHVLNHWR
jgi:hypothetical protein